MTSTLIRNFIMAAIHSKSVDRQRNDKLAGMVFSFPFKKVLFISVSRYVSLRRKVVKLKIAALVTNLI